MDDTSRQYVKTSRFIKNKIIHVLKIRGDKKIKYDKNVMIIKRPYIELITDQKHANYLFNVLSSKFIIVLRNYKERSINDNLDTLKIVPLQKNQVIPKSIQDPFKIKFSKPSGQYGIGISFKIDKADNGDEVMTLNDDLSFYDTKDLRDLETDTFKEKTSLLIFVKNIKHNIVDIFQTLEMVLP
jgi:hypothetical protein